MAGSGLAFVPARASANGMVGGCVGGRCRGRCVLLLSWKLAVRRSARAAPLVGCDGAFRSVRYVETRVGVGVVVRSLDGRVLVGRRVAERGRLLAIPGGKLDPGESVEACAMRELGEETGLMVREARTFTAVFVPGWVVAGVLVDLGVAVDAIAPQVREPDKFAELAWIDPARPPEDLFPATAALLERLV